LKNKTIVELNIVRKGRLKIIIEEVNEDKKYSEIRESETEYTDFVKKPNKYEKINKILREVNLARDEKRMLREALLEINKQSESKIESCFSLDEINKKSFEKRFNELPFMKELKKMKEIHKEFCRRRAIVFMEDQIEE